MTRGGKRKGSGRQKLPARNKAQSLTFTLSPRLAEYVKQLRNRSAAISALIEASEDFKRWKKRSEEGE